MAAMSSPMQREPSSSSNCSSERIAPHACYSRLNHEDSVLKPIIPRSKLLSQSNTVLDGATKSRLIQLFTTRKPVTSPKRIQSHFTCFYLTASNINEILSTSDKKHYQPRHSNPATPQASPFHDLRQLIEQSWRVSFGTLDFLEFIWTGHRSTKSWSSLLKIRPDIDYETNDSPFQYTEEDDFLAINLAVTYYYTAEGQPTLSLSIIAITEDAFNAINQHSSSPINNQPFSSPCFTTLPFVHRDIIIPTLCRWRNADIQNTLSKAAEGLAWTSGLVLNHHPSPFTCYTTSVDATTNVWIFPAITTASPPTSPSSSSSSTYSSPSLPSQALSASASASPESYHRRLPDPPKQRQYPHAALVPGRSVGFRAVASRLFASGVLDRLWIRRSEQFPLEDGWGRVGGIKRRWGV